jgi:hypothetical protein
MLAIGKMSVPQSRTGTSSAAGTGGGGVANSTAGE